MEPKVCNCKGVYGRDFKCKIHWHNKQRCDETMRHDHPIDEALTGNRLRTILHNFGCSEANPIMYSCASEREAVHMAYELLSLRAVVYKETKVEEQDGEQELPPLERWDKDAEAGAYSNAYRNPLRLDHNRHIGCRERQLRSALREPSKGLDSLSEPFLEYFERTLNCARVAIDVVTLDKKLAAIEMIQKAWKVIADLRSQGSPSEGTGVEDWSSAACTYCDKPKSLHFNSMCDDGKHFYTPVLLPAPPVALPEKEK